MAEDTRFGDALIAALEEAVAYERGELPDVRVDRVAITARHAGGAGAGVLGGGDPPDPP